MVTVASAFSRHLDRFQAYWGHLWSLSAEQRGLLVEQIVARRRAALAHDRDAQAAVVENLSAQLGGDSPIGEMAQEIAYYATHIFAESEDRILAEFARLEFFDEESAETQEQWIRDLFARMSREGLGRALNRALDG